MKLRLLTSFVAVAAFFVPTSAALAAPANAPTFGLVPPEVRRHELFDCDQYGAVRSSRSGQPKPAHAWIHRASRIWLTHAIESDTHVHQHRYQYDPSHRPDLPEYYGHPGKRPGSGLGWNDHLYL
jgi:hypothetical protein